MRYLSIPVVLVMLALLFNFGCKGDPDNTGIPVFTLPGNTGQPPAQAPQGPVLVAITIEPSAANIEIGGRQIYKAIGAYSDNAVIDITGSVTWFSTNETVGILSDRGVFEAFTSGYAGIGAYLQDFNTADGQTTIVYSDYAFANVFEAGEQPPGPVRNVEVVLDGNNAIISWDYSPESDIEGYNVYRTRLSGQGYDQDEPLNEDLIILNHFVDINPGGGVLYYVVAAVNEDEEIGAFSKEVELDFHPEPPWDE